MFVDIQSPTLGEARISKPKPQRLLLALHYLKKHPTKIGLASFLDETEKTALGWVHKYVVAIQTLKGQKIKWIFDDPGVDEEYIISVDGVHCRTWEPRTSPSSSWYSKKFNKAALAYELGISIHRNKLVWINGPFPAGQNDKMIFNKPNGLKSKIPDGKRGIADEGHVGDPNKLSTRNTFDSEELKEFKKRAKARHETFNSRLKAFAILRDPFRSTVKRLEKHKAAFEACCVIIQYEMDNGKPLFKV